MRESSFLKWKIGGERFEIFERRWNVLDDEMEWKWVVFIDENYCSWPLEKGEIFEKKALWPLGLNRVH